MNKHKVRYILKIIIFIVWIVFCSIGFGLWTQIGYEKSYPTAEEKIEMINIANKVANYGIFSKSNKMLLDNLEKYDIDEINLKKSFITIIKKDDHVNYFIKVYFDSEYIIESYEIFPKNNNKVRETIVSSIVGGGTAFMLGMLVIFIIYSSKKTEK